jgi:hypothetical protein
MLALLDWRFDVDIDGCEKRLIFHLGDCEFGFFIDNSKSSSALTGKSTRASFNLEHTSSTEATQISSSVHPAIVAEMNQVDGQTANA